MTSIKAEVTGVSIKAAPDGRLTSGMVGVPVSITFDSAWDGLTKTAVFRAGEQARSVKYAGDGVTVPWEVMRKSGQILYMGVEGRNSDGSLVIPTVWTQVGIIERGANGDCPSAGTVPAGGADCVTGTGCYYTPEVSQVDANTMKVSFTASEEGMEAVADQMITLPAGADGITPHIGENGNWFVGETDSGVPASGWKVTDAVRYTAQELTPEQKAQARKNIGASHEQSRLAGHSWSVIGDSISQDNLNTNRQYWDHIVERAGNMAVYNYGVAGERISHIAARADESAYCDIITVFGGVNDFFQNNPTELGALTDATGAATFYGALKKLCSKLQATYPKSLIIFVTPLGSSTIDGGENSLGLTVGDYADAIKEVCAQYKIPVVDACNESLLNPYEPDMSALYFTDGTHLNALGHEVLSYMIEAEILRHYIPSLEVVMPSNTYYVNATFTGVEDGARNFVFLLVENPDTSTSKEVSVSFVKSGEGAILTNVSGTPIVWDYNSVDDFEHGRNAGNNDIGATRTDEGETTTITATSGATCAYIAVNVPHVSDTRPFTTNLSNVQIKINGSVVPILGVSTFRDNSTGAIADIEWGKAV